MREAGARRAPVLNRREQRSQIKAESVGILMMRPAGLADEVKRITADLLHRALAMKREPVLAADFKFQLGATHIIDAVTFIEQPYERANGR